MGRSAVMESTETTSRDPVATNVQVAVLDDGRTAVVRVAGRGNFMNSVPLKKFADRLARKGHPERFIMDLAECETLDSTFMGVLASISLLQTRNGRNRLVVCNVNPHVQKLLTTLGLSRLMDVNGAANTCAADLARAELAPVEDSEVSHTEQISHTLEAHKTLTRVDGDNAVRFQSVIHYLEKSLEEEQDPK
ncbi:MAG: hypothetical protein PWP23_3343 [Candidatus Sumerlaeota bacterium]|nr:hypothetical protein [Candidatus Sumerlaeota bacterium]